VSGSVRSDGGEPTDGWDDPVHGTVSWRTLFSGDVTDTDTLTCGVGTLQAQGWLGLHRHANAEVYFVLEGAGIVTLAGVEHQVKAGAAVSIPADVEHGIRNAGDATLRMFYCLAADSFSDVEYCFSNAD
jgi:mannose-6-phosphate isomerase-like protein (cupin superfamily)